MMEEAVKVMEATEGGGVARVIGAFFLPSATCAVQKKLGAGAGLPGETRVKMLREVLRGHPLVGVDGWLAEQPGNPGAAAAVRELTEAVREVAGRGVEIVQVCGADLFPKLKNFFSEKKPVVCIVDRPADYDVEAFALQKRKEGARIWVHRMEGEGMSSTEVRNAWRQKNMDVLREMLPEAILQFHERYGISYGEEDRGRYANPEANITTARGKREAGEAYQRAQEMISRYQIPLEEDLTLFPRSSLGEGITGEVIKGQRRTGKEVACKILEFGRGTPRDAQNLVQTLKSECEAAVRLRHKDLTHLVPLESHFLDAPSLILVTIMPLFHCSLKHHLESPAGRRFQPSSRLFPSPFSYQVLLHVALGMSELHSAGILHRDLCATNILLEWSPEGEGREGGSLLRAAVCDFGLSLHKSFPMSSAMRGSLLHYAPEAAASKGTYLEASDVFMWAYMGVEMSSCAEVWRGMGKQAAIERTGQGERPEEQAGDRVPWFKKLQEASWSQEHANRPSFEKIVRIFQENESS
jgi:nicotinic acid mononucleotide adenylyltransferase